ncbi:MULTISPECIES: hypothetical protein [unclassified Nocardia]|uniref:hypothetical protein n=1 Tax=unclassified Nocardia TaxID=2637762 RepID=UPI00278C2654|nr:MULTISPECIES: hypothetical protein [unclassified Nocardia]
MSDWIATLAAAVLSGGGIAGLLQWWTGRRRQSAEAEHIEAQADATDMETAERVTTLALNLLGPYEREQQRLAHEVAALRAEVAAVKRELDASLREQHRLNSLFRQAVQALQEFFAIAREHNIPTPDMSAELEAEITAGGVS